MPIIAIKIIMGSAAALSVISTLLMSWFISKYEKSAVHVIAKNNGVEIEKITRDPKWKKASLVTKAIALVMFLITFMFIVLYYYKTK